MFFCQKYQFKLISVLKRPSPVHLPVGGRFAFSDTRKPTYWGRLRGDWCALEALKERKGLPKGVVTARDWEKKVMTKQTWGEK